jgi:hypothetical protein
MMLNKIVTGDFIIPSKQLLVHLTIPSAIKEPINIYFPLWVRGIKISITQQSDQEIRIHCNSDYKFERDSEKYNTFIIRSSEGGRETLYKFIAAYDNWYLISDGGRFNQNFER